MASGVVLCHFISMLGVILGHLTSMLCVVLAHLQSSLGVDLVHLLLMLFGGSYLNLMIVAVLLVWINASKLA